MITAKEAKALYDESGAEAEALLHSMEPKIIDAAKAGKRSVFCYVDACEPRGKLQVTPLQQQVMDKLHALGYRVQFTFHGEGYVPRGLVDNDGRGPLYQNYGFAIHW